MNVLHTFASSPRTQSSPCPISPKLEKKRVATARIKSVFPRASVAQYRHTSPTRSLRWPPQSGCVQGTSRRISHRRQRGPCTFLPSYCFTPAAPTHDHGVCASVASRAPHASRTPSSAWLLGYSPQGRGAVVTGQLNDVEEGSIPIGRAQKVVIATNFSDGRWRDEHPTLAASTEQPLMQTTIVEGHRISLAVCV